MLKIKGQFQVVVIGAGSHFLGYCAATEEVGKEGGGREGKGTWLL